MFGDKVLKKVKKTTQSFFEKAGFKVEVEAERRETGEISVRIKTEEPGTLIGQGGEVLKEIQHLLRAIIRKGTEENFYLDIDINGYKEKKERYLKETARSLANEAALTGEEKAMPSLSSYERRVVHLELADRSDVATESRGEGRERRVIIKPRP